MSSKKIHVAAWPKSKNRKNNPYNYILYEAMADLADVDEFNHRRMSLSSEQVLHLHWPDKIVADKRTWRMRWRSWRLRSAMKKLQKRGGKVVWTVHNLRAHKLRHPDLAKKLLEKFINLVDGFIFLSAESQKLFFEEYPRVRATPSIVTPHIHYGDYYRLESGNDLAREHMNIHEHDTVLLMFGKISEHKGLLELVEAKTNSELGCVRVVVAGSANSDSITQQGISAAKRNPDFIVNDARIPTDQVAAYFQISDGVILPYTAILNSGTAMLALSLHRPVIGPRVGSFIALEEEFGGDWVHLYDAPLDAEKFDNACSWLRSRQVNVDIREIEALSRCDPKVVAAQTVTFYRQLLDE